MCSNIILSYDEYAVLNKSSGFLDDDYDSWYIKYWCLGGRDKFPDGLLRLGALKFAKAVIIEEKIKLLQEALDV